MALVYADRVKETSTTTGTGTYSLDGATAGFQTFVAGIGTANTCFYCATDGTDWEVGLGTVTDATPDTLARTTILQSSNADAAVNWAAGTRTIFCTIPGDKTFIGPSSATDNAIARFDGTSGRTLQNSAPAIDDNGTILPVATAAGFPSIQLTAGTLQTTPAVGSIEMDANCVYMTTDAGNRGVNLIEHFIRFAVARTLTSTVSAQAMFNDPANGRLTLETGTYFFEVLYSLSGMSATSGNSAFDLLGAGTATLGNVLYYAVGIDGPINVAVAQTGSTSASAASPASIVEAGNSTAQETSIRGSFEVTVAGTIIPSIALKTAAAAILRAGGYFRLRRVGATGVASVGQWD